MALGGNPPPDDVRTEQESRWRSQRSKVACLGPDGRRDVGGVSDTLPSLSAFARYRFGFLY
jgi:hypothetical protein